MQCLGGAFQLFLSSLVHHHEHILARHLAFCLFLFVKCVIVCVTAMKMRLRTLLRTRRAQADAVASYANGMKEVTCDTSAS
jgi:hypothetical protein